MIRLGLVLALMLAHASQAQNMKPTPFPPMVKMRSLAGTWKGEAISNPLMIDKNARIIYESVSGGQAVVERLLIGKDEKDEMVTVYHQEGDQLMMTHYCSSNTQPRMRTNGWPKNLAEFKLEFIDSTNILKANWMNVTYLKIEFLGPDEIRHTWKSHDPKELPAVFVVRRVR